jgi:hypothetical protein
MPENAWEEHRGEPDSDAGRQGCARAFARIAAIVSAGGA